MKMHFPIWKDGFAMKINRALLENVWYLLSNASLDKSFWDEALVYASHLMNKLLLTVGGKTLLDIWSNEAAQDYSLLRIFGCSTYFGVKDDKLNREQNSLYFWVSIFLKGDKPWDFKNKKIVLSWYVTFDTASFVRVYLLAGEEDKDQRCITASGDTCHSTISSCFSISWNFIEYNTG